MFKDYKEFCDSTPARDISFRAFLTALDDNREKHQVIGSWTGTILPYLEKHHAIDKRQRAAFLKKSTRKALEAIVDEVFETVSNCGELSLYTLSTIPSKLPTFSFLGTTHSATTLKLSYQMSPSKNKQYHPSTPLVLQATSVRSNVGIEI